MGYFDSKNPADRLPKGGFKQAKGEQLSRGAKYRRIAMCCCDDNDMYNDMNDDIEETSVSEEGDVCPCCAKKTTRSQDQQRKLLNRLKRIEGQVRGLQSMIERDAYCNDILVQSAAVNAAMNAFNKELLECHIRHCVVRDIREGKDEVVDELLKTLQKLMK